MFLQLKLEGHPPVCNREDLFDHYWTQAEQRVALRLGRSFAWNKLIDVMVTWLSDHQQLSAPEHVLNDDYHAEAPALASENILVRSSGQYRFFHEAFFDYAFARRFNAMGGKMIDFLARGEQQLFQRAQVRQVLTYLRAKETRRYLEELEGLLTSDLVRFHIKSLIFQWLGSLADPRQDEWRMLQKIDSESPSLHSHIRSVTWGRKEWFDILDEAGFLDSSLSGLQLEAQQECILLFTHPSLSEHRSKRIATLLVKHRQPGTLWDQYLRNICNTGSVFHSPEMFDLFLRLIDDGTLDDLRPGFAVNDDWWSVLFPISQKHPDLASVAIGHWFDRVITKCEEPSSKHEDDNDGSQIFGVRLRENLDRNLGGSGTSVILDSAKAPLAFTENLLPRIVRVLDQISEDRPDHLQGDPIWSWRSYGDQPHNISSALLVALAKALESLAVSETNEMDKQLAPYVNQQQDTVAYLVLRAWTAAPPEFANRVADYLAANPFRLKVGYTSWGGGGYAANHRSAQAVQFVSANASMGKMAIIEKTILELTDQYERQHPRIRGARQLELLEAFGESKLSSIGRSKLYELRRKFPDEDLRSPRPSEVTWVGPPISQDAQSRMSDEQWLQAMRKYAGLDHHPTRRGIAGGGERELASAIQEQAKGNPSRFIHLAEQMPDDLPSSYFAAILNGASDSDPTSYCGSSKDERVDQLSLLLHRIHALPNKPCGKAIAWLITKLGDPGWPEDVIKIVKWHAVNDPDPEREEWEASDAGHQPHYRGDIHEAGMNSTRGVFAEAIARILFDQPTRSDLLLETIHHLASDKIIAVRACAIEALVALLNSDSSKAIPWFFECFADSRLHGIQNVERFVHYAGYRDYLAIRPALMVMANSDVPSVVESAARQICILALDHDEATADAEWIRGGTVVMRHAAADVYSTNIANETVGPACRTLLKPFFQDPDETVRSEAASAFHHLADLNRNEQETLLEEFLKSDPNRAALAPVLRALETSPIQLPEQVCRFAECCITAYKAEASDIRRPSALIAMDLSKIIIRLYTQTENPIIQKRCLDMIDEMEFHHFLGLNEEMNKLDR